MKEFIMHNKIALLTEIQLPPKSSFFHRQMETLRVWNGQIVKRERRGRALEHVTANGV